ncbi:MAG: GNAT family N-acetyltransferase [Chloroflexi bacterium]|nr:GNAT family N-acetyltransferase [Chloroflexota bacterium]
MDKKIIIRDLGEGLLLRHANMEDSEALSKFNGEIHADPGEDFAENVAAWTRDLITRPHPTFKVEDFTIVEDTKSRKIVSSLNLIPQTWSYAGIEFGVGRPEVIGTHPDYRRRGLVRAQMDVVHQWSAQRGHLLQVITGIPWYYRMFGYEMALNLGGGRRSYPANIPKLKKDEAEPFLIRPAKDSDLDFISQIYEQTIQRDLIACLRDEDLWNYELHGRSDKNDNALKLRIIESADGHALGFIAHPGEIWGGRLRLSRFELKSGVSWLSVIPCVLRYLQTTAEKYAKKDENASFQGLHIKLGEEHPAYRAAPELFPEIRKPYAWYLRVSDLHGFLRHIKPVLEERLAESPHVGHNGELNLSFYKDGVKLVFDNGSLKDVEPWQPKDPEDGMAFFPNLTFLQLLFGFRDMDELSAAFPDCFCNESPLGTRALLKSLFPKQSSDVWPVS